MVPVLAGLSAAILARKIGRVVLQLGPLVVALGFVVLIFTVQAVGGTVTPWHLIAGLALSGAGFGMVVAPVVGRLVQRIGPPLGVIPDMDKDIDVSVLNGEIHDKAKEE